MSARTPIVFRLSGSRSGHKNFRLNNQDGELVHAFIAAPVGRTAQTLAKNMMSVLIYFTARAIHKLDHLQYPESPLAKTTE
jgi:hypothetical protein